MKYNKLRLHRQILNHKLTTKQKPMKYFRLLQNENEMENWEKGKIS